MNLILIHRSLTLDCVMTYENMMLINEVQDNSTHVALLDVSTLSSIPNLNSLVI
jgi:hypothetical protein